MEEITATVHKTAEGARHATNVVASAKTDPALRVTRSQPATRGSSAAPAAEPSGIQGCFGRIALRLENRP